jgi:hypothetical protein
LIPRQKDAQPTATTLTVPGSQPKANAVTTPRTRPMYIP